MIKDDKESRQLKNSKYKRSKIQQIPKLSPEKKNVHEVLGISVNQT